MQGSGSNLKMNDDVTAILSIERVFTPSECDTLVQSVSASAGLQGLVGNYQVSDLRRSTIRIVENNPSNHWVFARLRDLIARVNQQYKFQLRGFIDPVQVAQYGTSDYFDWHIDLGRGQASLRKLSVTIQLAASTAYDGGELQFQGLTDVQQPRAQGAAIVFPSFLPHRVTAVTRGTRYSLVAWASGPSFR